MSKDQLITNLKALADDDDTEVAHEKADMLLLAYIADPEIVEAFNNVPRWYA